MIGATKRLNEHDTGFLLVDNLGYLDGFTQNAADILKLDINQYLQFKKDPVRYL